MKMKTLKLDISAFIFFILSVFQSLPTIHMDGNRMIFP